MSQLSSLFLPTLGTGIQHNGGSSAVSSAVGPAVMHCTVTIAKSLSYIALFVHPGYVVMRYFCKSKELRRQRLYEKALDVCATSPFARFVQRWILCGVGSGARVAAVVGSRCRGIICGYVLLSYPLAVSAGDMCLNVPDLLWHVCSMRHQGYGTLACERQHSVHPMHVCMAGFPI